MSAREFTERITVTPSFDHRFDPEKWSQGCGSMLIHFALVGPLGAVTTWLNTGWMWEPLTAVPSGYGGMPNGPWGNEQRARGRLGVDIISRGRERPMAGPISCHAAKPPEGKDWFIESEGCEFTESGACWGDTGYLVGDTFLERLGRDGDKAGFEYLREIHDDWLAPEKEGATS